MDKIIENNQVTVMGEIASEFEFSHEVFGEGFYMLELLVKRLSDSFDRIPVMISERLIDVTQDYRGELTVLRRKRTVWCCLSLPGRLLLWKPRMIR